MEFNADELALVLGLVDARKKALRSLWRPNVFVRAPGAVGQAAEFAKLQELELRIRALGSVDTSAERAG